MIPVSTATGTPGTPIPVGADKIAITPDGKTIYTLGAGGLIPIATATNTPGTLIPLPHGISPTAIAITPDSRTVYVTSVTPDAVTPVPTATNKARKPVKVGMNDPALMAFTPDSKTLYVAGLSSGDDVVTPVSVAANTAGATIQVAGDDTDAMAMTPDGSTLYVMGNGAEAGAPADSAVTPVSTTTDTPRKPIPDPGNLAAILITPARCSRR